MKKVLFIVLVLITFLFCQSLFAQDNTTIPTFMGFYKGSVIDIFPKATVNEATYFINSGTTGIGQSMPDLVTEMATDLLRGQEKAAMRYCKGNSVALIDSVDVSTTPFGDYNNVLVKVEGNMICIK